MRSLIWICGIGARCDLDFGQPGVPDQEEDCGAPHAVGDAVAPHRLNTLPSDPAKRMEKPQSQEPRPLRGVRGMTEDVEHLQES